jgi:hypothetical protein
MRRIVFFITLLATGILTAKAENIITDPTLGYSIYLPGDSWIRVVKNTNHHQFYDTSFTYQSQISIVRHSYSSTDYPTPESWTRANFIAYEFSIDYSFDPWASMLFSDTITVKQGTSWATESYSVFFSLDTACGAWSEYTRFTAGRGYGWELYAIGDTSDMMSNIATYAAILAMVQLPTDSNARILSRPIPAAHASKLAADANRFTDRYYDPLGRVFMVRSGHTHLPAGLFILPHAQKAVMQVR